METILLMIGKTIEIGRRFGKEELLYEAAYKYGQAVAMISMLYAQHAAGIIRLDDKLQSMLAPMHQKLELIVESLSRSAGNGHKLGARKSEARKSLLGVIEMLREEVHSAQLID